MASRTIICVGDSITRGQISSDWVARLGTEYLDARVVNAGVNGELAWNVLQRLDSVIGAEPDDVILLIGLNDVEATFSDKMLKSYRRMQRIPEAPDLAWFRENVETILRRLAGETHARIATVEIPPLSEHLTSTMNLRVGSYNQALREISAAHNVRCLGLYERLAARIPRAPASPEFSGRAAPIIWSALQHRLLRRSWNEISRRAGYAVLTDGVHLNDDATGELLPLVREFLQAGVP